MKDSDELVNNMKHSIREYFINNGCINSSIEQNLLVPTNIYIAPVKEIHESRMVCWPFSNRNEIYVDKVEDTNKDFKKTQILSVTLNNVDTELQENREKIKILTENNKALSLKVDTLSKNVDNKNKEIKELEQENKYLNEMVDYFKNLFSRLVKFIKNKMFGKDKEREDYWKVSKDMYEHGIFSDDTIESIKDDYIWNKENDKNKNRDRNDFEL